MERTKQRGEPAGDVANFLILEALYNNEKLSFEQLVEKLSRNLSRGTVNKYLNTLYQKGLVTREGRRGPYYIPKDKREKVKNFLEKERLKQRMSEYIDAATPQEIEELQRALEEKDRIIKKLQETFVKPLFKRLETELEEVEKMPGAYEKLFYDLIQKVNLSRRLGKKLGKNEEELIKQAEEARNFWKTRVSELQEEIEKLKKFLEE